MPPSGNTDSFSLSLSLKNEIFVYTLLESEVKFSTGN